MNDLRWYKCFFQVRPTFAGIDVDDFTVRVVRVRVPADRVVSFSDLCDSEGGCWSVLSVQFCWGTAMQLDTTVHGVENHRTIDVVKRYPALLPALVRAISALRLHEEDCENRVEHIYTKEDRNE